MTVSKRTVDANYRAGFYQDLTEGFKTFIRNENTVTFYALLCEVCPVTGELIVSLNTEFDYQRRQRQHEASDIRFDSDFWHYQAVVRSKPVEAELIQKYYGKDEESLIQLARLTLKDFTKSTLFRKLKKTPDFEWICQSINPTTSHINL